MYTAISESDGCRSAAAASPHRNKEKKSITIFNSEQQRTCNLEGEEKTAKAQSKKRERKKKRKSPRRNWHVGVKGSRTSSLLFRVSPFCLDFCFCCIPSNNKKAHVAPHCHQDESARPFAVYAPRPPPNNFVV